MRATYADEDFPRRIFNISCVLDFTHPDSPTFTPRDQKMSEEPGDEEMDGKRERKNE